MSVIGVNKLCPHCLRLCFDGVCPGEPHFVRAVHVQRRWIEDDDPGDMDPSQSVHVQVVDEWRRL